MTKPRTVLLALLAMVAPGCAHEVSPNPIAGLQPVPQLETPEPPRTSVWVQDDRGSWIQEPREVQSSTVAGEYVMVELGATSRIWLSGGGAYSRTFSACVGATMQADGGWAVVDAGVRLFAVNGSADAKEAAEEILGLAIVGDGYALVPETKSWSFPISGPTRSNCFRSVSTTTVTHR